MISRIIKDKGIDNFFAVEILRKKNVDLNFVFCGQLQKSVDNYNIRHFKKK